VNKSEGVAELDCLLCITLQLMYCHISQLPFIILDSVLVTSSKILKPPLMKVFIN